jgi:hypothetical protein
MSETEYSLWHKIMETVWIMNLKYIHINNKIHISINIKASEIVWAWLIWVTVVLIKLKII